MKIKELANIILETCSPNKSQKLIEGIIWERLHLRNYDKLLSEQVVEDEELENNVEDEEQPDIVLAEPEKKGIEKGLDKDEPEATVDGEEEPEEPEDEEPEASVEPEEPISTGPILGKDTEPAATVEPSKTIKTISTEQARELLSYKGKIFNAIFTKKNGERRAAKGLTGVRKYTKGGKLPYSPKEKGVIPFYDLKIGNGPSAYRMLNLAGLEALNINGQQYKIDHSLNNKDKIQEIKVNNPELKYYDQWLKDMKTFVGDRLTSQQWNLKPKQILDLFITKGFMRPEVRNDVIQSWRTGISKLDEIKVNDPIITTKLVLELVDEVMHMRQGNSGKIVAMLEDLGFDRGDGTSGWNYIKDHPELNNIFYIELKKIKNSLDEIKVNNPAIAYNNSRVDNYKPFERGKNVKQTIINCLQKNQFLTEPQIIEIIFRREGMFRSAKPIQDALRYIPEVDRKQVINPKTKKKIYVYFTEKPKEIEEIKINKPLNLTEFPIEINNSKDWELAMKRLEELGYKWNSNDKPTKLKDKKVTYPHYIISNLPKYIMHTEFKDWQNKNHPELKKI